MSKETLANSFYRLMRRGPKLTALFLAGVVLLTFAAWPTVNPVGHGNADAFVKIVVTFCLGKRGCTPGFGVCKITLRGAGACSSTVNATLSPLSNDRMEAVFEAAPPNAERFLEIAEDLILDEASARKLGFKSVTILKGSYAYDAAKGKFGGVILNMKTVK